MASIRMIGKNLGKSGFFKGVLYHLFLGVCVCAGLVFSSLHIQNFEAYRGAILGVFHFPAQAIKPVFALPGKVLNADENTDAELQRKRMELFFLRSELAKEEKQNSGFTDFKEVFDNIPKKNSTILFAKPEYYGGTPMVNDISVTVEEKNRSFLTRVKINDVVLSDKGIFGRVSGIYGSKITIISIFSFLSRVPVVTETSKNYGMAYGGGIQIELLQPFGSKEKIIDGEQVFTSDENHLITGAIPFGKIKLEGTKILIIPNAEFRPEVVGIVSIAK